MNVHVEVQSASREAVPSEEDMCHWITTALADLTKLQHVEVSVRIVDTAEMSQLNKTYRHKEGSTNVLSFPADLPPELELPLLGDIVICAPVVIAEAAQQGKSAAAHWTHMTIHGTLHLLGYDHIEEEEAAIMESLESAILKQLDISCPYHSQLPHECAPS